MERDHNILGKNLFEKKLDCGKHRVISKRQKFKSLIGISLKPDISS